MVKIKNNWLFLDKLGYPVEGFRGRPIITFLRRLIYTKKITTKETWEKQTGINLPTYKRSRKIG